MSNLDIPEILGPKFECELELDRTSGLDRMLDLDPDIRIQPAKIQNHANQIVIVCLKYTLYKSRTSSSFYWRNSLGMNENLRPMRSIFPHPIPGEACGASHMHGLLSRLWWNWLFPQLSYSCWLHWSMMKLDTKWTRVKG